MESRSPSRQVERVYGIAASDVNWDVNEACLMHVEFSPTTKQAEHLLLATLVLCGPRKIQIDTTDQSQMQRLPTRSAL